MCACRISVLYTRTNTHQQPPYSTWQIALCLLVLRRHHTWSKTEKKIYHQNNQHNTVRSDRERERWERESKEEWETGVSPTWRACFHHHHHRSLACEEVDRIHVCKVNTQEWINKLSVWFWFCTYGQLLPCAVIAIDRLLKLCDIVIDWFIGIVYYTHAARLLLDPFGTSALLLAWAPPAPKPRESSGMSATHTHR